MATKEEKAILAKSLELSGLNKKDFEALTEGEQGNWLNTAKAAIAEENATPAKPDLVKMAREGKMAEVHPAEVENYKLGNWAVVE